jgi:hypothetical protein
MAMKNERDVKEKVKAVLQTLPRVWYFMPAANGYGTLGIPDFIGCYCGQAFAVETKFGGGKTTNWQDIQISRIREAHGAAWVVNEKTFEAWEKEFYAWAKRAEMLLPALRMLGE